MEEDSKIFVVLDFFVTDRLVLVICYVVVVLGLIIMLCL